MRRHRTSLKMVSTGKKIFVFALFFILLNSCASFHETLMNNNESLDALYIYRLNHNSI